MMLTRRQEASGVVPNSSGGLLWPIRLQMIPDDLALQYSTCETDMSQAWDVMILLAFYSNKLKEENVLHI